MKLCVVTTAFPHRDGQGEGAFVWECVRAIANLGHEVRVLAMDHPGVGHHEVWEGIPIWRPPYWWPREREMLRRDVGGLPVNWRRYRLARVQMLPFMMVHTLAAAKYARGCDLVHAHWTLSAVAVQMGRQVHHCPVVATLQGSDVFQAARLPGIAAATRWALRRSYRITVLSEALRVATLSLGVTEDQIEVIPNGVNTEVFRPGPDERREPIILYVGSLIERKGVSYLVAAMPGVLKSLPQHRLVVVGDGPDRPLLEQQVTTLGLEAHVQFEGFLSQAKVKEWMSRASLLVLPSLEEGLGVVLLEALASGVPIVASDVGGIVDVVTDDVGVLVPSGDSTALMKGICRVLTDRDGLQKRRRLARERAVAIYDWNRISERYTQVFQTALANG
jgi:glycosyltransferase involved in cell wall biosynthesis